MNQIPEEFQLKEKINHTDYLINGEINSWNGKQTNVYSTLLCDSDEKEPDLIGYTPEMSGEYALKASNNGAINKTPCLAGLNMVVFPIMMAGINKANVSFNG